jgi:hypothetical protein
MEREPIRLPTWRRTLDEYRRAFERYHATPASLAATAFLDRAIARLRESYHQPGRFDLGLVLLTPGAGAELARSKHLAEEFLLRHKHGDWGELPPEDIRANDAALRRDSRLLSAYRTRRDGKLWIITEWDRSTTTLLLPEEY